MSTYFGNDWRRTLHITLGFYLGFFVCLLATETFDTKITHSDSSAEETLAPNNLNQTIQWIKKDVVQTVHTLCSTWVGGNCYPEAYEALNCSQAADGVWDKKSSVLCLRNLILHAAFWETAGGKSGLAKTLRSVECGVCLRGEKICHYGVVVYSNVRERAPMRDSTLHPYLPHHHPLPSMRPHAHCRALSCSTCRLPHLEPLPNTRNSYFCVRELSVSAHLCFVLLVSKRVLQTHWCIFPPLTFFF